MTMAKNKSTKTSKFVVLAACGWLLCWMISPVKSSMPAAEESWKKFEKSASSLLAGDVPPPIVLTPAEKSEYGYAVQFPNGIREATFIVKPGSGTTDWIVFPTKSGFVDYVADGKVRYIFPSGAMQDDDPLTRWRIDHRESGVRIGNRDTRDVTVHLAFY